MFMSREEECELKAIEFERIAANLANKDEPFRRIHLDLVAKRRKKRRRPLTQNGAETNVLLELRRRIVGEDAVRGGLVFVGRNALSS